MKVTAIRGHLGWGNRKGGLEAYGPDGRWGGEGPYAAHGDLLGDALERAGASEGATLIVVSVPRFGAPRQMVIDAFMEALGEAHDIGSTAE